MPWLTLRLRAARSLRPPLRSDPHWPDGANRHSPIQSSQKGRYVMPEPTPIVYVVDGDNSVRESLKDVICEAGSQPLLFGSAEAFLSHPRPLCPSCMVLEVLLPGL